MFNERMSCFDVEVPDGCSLADGAYLELRLISEAKRHIFERVERFAVVRYRGNSTWTFSELSNRS
jgi:hypothetical protein